MSRIDEMSAPYANLMKAPLPPRQGVCDICRGPIPPSDTRCAPCASHPGAIDAVLPISYGYGSDQLHHEIRGAKGEVPVSDGMTRAFRIGLGCVLSRFIGLHERCLAEACGTERVHIVTTVPSSDPAKVETHPMRWIASQIPATAGRFQALLSPVASGSGGRRTVDPDRFICARHLTGEEVILLIDDVWTTGSSMRSAALALKASGAHVVAGVVIERFLSRDWKPTAKAAAAIEASTFEWGHCALHTPA